MRLKSRILTGFIIILLALAMILPVSAFEDTETRHIENQPPGYDADMFVTESGIGHGGPLVTVLDPNLDIWAGLFFEDIKVNYWHHVENATLWLRTASSLDFDADSSFTIYGVNDYRYFGLGTKGSHAFGAPSTITSAPLTSAHVNVNSSQFYGPKWWDIDVTNIVRELKSNPHWDGPGFVRSDPGDNMAFIILGAKGHDSRWFYALQAGNGMEAKLEIHWGGSSHPPSGYDEDEVEYIETYGNYSIWELSGKQGYTREPIEYTFQNGTDPYKFLYSNLQKDGPFVIASLGSSAYGGYRTSQRKLVRTYNGTLWAVYTRRTGDTHQLFIKKSDDNGTTWDSETQIGADWTNTGTSTSVASMAVDSLNNIHVVWTTKNALYSINYSKFDGASWSSPIEISGGGGRDGFGQLVPHISVDSYDHLHVVWVGQSTGFGTDEIWHKEYLGVSWGPGTRISTYAGMDAGSNSYPAIAVDSNDVQHVVWQGVATGFPADRQIWYANSTNGWTYPVRLSIYLNMDDDDQSYPSIAVDSNDVQHVVWEGETPGYTQDQIWYVNSTNGWTYPLRISTEANMHTQVLEHACIAIDSNETLYVVFTNTQGWQIWYTERETEKAWIVPEVLHNPVQTLKFPISRWARWPTPGSIAGGFIIVDFNGTVIMDNGDPLIFDDPEDAQDWIDTEYTDPEDPDPAGAWSTGPGGETGPFSRFKMRLYFLILGFGCVFGPVLFFSWRRPTGYYLAIGAIIMIAGLGFLLAIGDI